MRRMPLHGRRSQPESLSGLVLWLACGLRIAIAVIGTLVSPKSADAQSAVATSGFCADSTSTMEGYTACALWYDGREVRRGADGESVGRPAFLRPIALTHLVVGDSAKIYAMKFERRTRQATGLLIAGEVLIAGGFAIANTDRCTTNPSGPCDSQRFDTGIVGLASALVGLGCEIASLPLMWSANRAIGKAIWWNNRRYARPTSGEIDRMASRPPP